MASERRSVVEKPDLGELLAQIEEGAGAADRTEVELLTDFSAKYLLDYIGSLSPLWQRAIQAAREETRLPDWKLLCAWTARTLEEARHINVPVHPLFQADLLTLAETVCSECTEKFKPLYAGQRYCSNKCGSAAYNREHPKPKKKIVQIIEV